MLPWGSQAPHSSSCAAIKRIGHWARRLGTWSLLGSCSLHLLPCGFLSVPSSVSCNVLPVPTPFLSIPFHYFPFPASRAISRVQNVEAASVLSRSFKLLAISFETKWKGNGKEMERKLKGTEGHRKNGQGISNGKKNPHLNFVNASEVR